MYSCICSFPAGPQKGILFDLIPDAGEFCLLLAEFRMVSLHLLKDQLDAPVKHLLPQRFLLNSLVSPPLANTITLCGE